MNTAQQIYASMGAFFQAGGSPRGKGHDLRNRHHRKAGPGRAHVAMNAGFGDKVKAIKAKRLAKYAAGDTSVYVPGVGGGLVLALPSDSIKSRNGQAWVEGKSGYNYGYLKV